MIFVDRGDEPDELADERSYRLAYASIHGRPENARIGGYDPDSVRKRLIDRQFGCCAYCGKFIEDVGEPIEHFRPKSYAKTVAWSKLPPEPVDDADFFQWFDAHLSCDAPETKRRETWVRDEDRYWWLAWTWENVVYACGTCNSQTYKGNCFPLEINTNALPLHDQPPGGEQPLLLDPSRYDPLDHLRFVPDLLGGGWALIPRTKFGRWTMAMLGLHNRPSLRTHWTNCAVDIVNNGAFERFFNTMGRKIDINQLRNEWTTLQKNLIYTRADYRTLRWCVFDHYFRNHKLKTRGLDLHHPWNVVARSPKAIFTTRPELDPLPDNLQMRVRALPSRLDSRGQDELKDLLADICRHQPATATELATIIRRDARYLKHEYLDRLTNGAPSRLKYDARSTKYHG